MANSNTANYGLVKPQVGAATDNWGSLLNGNFDVIDSQMKTNADDAAAAASSASQKVPLNGATMTGPLILSEPGSDLSANNQAASVKYVKDKVAAAEIAAGAGLPITGGTMTGFITLVGDPTSPLHAATKQYADQFLPRNGSLAMTGALTLNGAPTSDLQAANKGYVDGTFLKTIGGTMTGAIALPGDPTAPLHAATKQYVDAKASSVTGVAFLNVFSTQTFSGPIVMPSLSVTSSISCGSLTSSGNVTAYSDARLKQDVRTIPNALALVDRLRGVHYRRKDTQSANIGVIAQEVREVLPEIVMEDSDGMLSVAYGNIVAVLIEAVKELSAKVEELEAR